MQIFGVAGVRAFCHGQIAHQEVPRHIRFVDEFPMTVIGKMQKYLMRAEMERVPASVPLRQREPVNDDDFNPGERSSDPP